MTRPVALSRLAMRGPQVRICLTFSMESTAGLPNANHLVITQARLRISCLRG